MRNDFEFKPCRTRDVRLCGHGLPDLDQGFGAPTIEFAAFSLGCSGARPMHDRRRQSLDFQIVIEPDGGQDTDRRAAFEDDDMGSGSPQREPAVIVPALGVQNGTLIDPPGVGDDVEAPHALDGHVPALSRRAVSDKQGKWHAIPRLDCKSGWLNPEIMARCRSGEPQHRYSQNGGSHLDPSADKSGSLTLFLNASIAILVLMAAAPVAAHSGTGLQGGFAAGFAHPFSGADHMLAMISVGLWGAVLGRPLITVLPMVFPGVMAVGGVLGIAGVHIPPVELGIAISVLVLGGLILGSVRLPVGAACGIVAGFAIFHGYAHGEELPSAADPVGYSVGFVMATGLLHLAGIAIGMIKDRPGGAIALRCAGGLVAGCGAWFLGRAL